MQKRSVQLLTIALGLGFIAYLPAVTRSFLSDDYVLVNGVIEGGPFGVFSSEGSRFFRPLVSLSLFADVSLWGLDARGFHATNILIHVANSIWLYLLAGCIGFWIGLEVRDRRAASGLSALVFLLHPSHTEAVSWISGRGDLLATFFALGSLTCYVRWRYLADTRFPWISYLLFGGALAAKESAVCLPLLIAVVEALRWLTKPGPGALKSMFIHVGPYFGWLALYLTVRRLSIGHWIGGYGADAHFQLSQIGDRMLIFLARSLLPPLSDKATLLWTTGAVVGLLIASVVFKRVSSGRWPRPAILTGAAMVFFLCTLVPIIGLQTSVNTVTGERFVYLPSVFAVLAWCSTLRAVLARKTTWWNLGVAVLCLVCMISLTRSNLIWHRAGKIAREIVSKLNGVDTETAVLLNLPVSLDGAYIFQQGLFLALKQKGAPADVRVVERFALRESVAEFSVQRQDDSISVHSADHAATLADWPPWHQRAFRVEYAQTCQHGFLGRLPEVPAEARFFVFSGGSLREMAGSVFPQQVAEERRYDVDFSAAGTSVNASASAQSPAVSTTPSAAQPNQRER